MKKGLQQGRLVTVCAIVVSIAWAGCTDLVVSNEDAEVLGRADSGKLRHEHLLDRAVRYDAAGKSASNGQLGLIIAVQAGVSKQRVVERYRVSERYRINERYDYEYVFDGFAWSVDDLAGSSDYQAFLDALAQDPDILWFEPDFDVNLPASQVLPGAGGQVVPWSVAAIGGQTSWAQSGDGQGAVEVDLYILDTGVAAADPGDPEDDLRIVENIDFREGSTNAADYDGHGTHVAGIAAAADDHDGLVGVAPGARVHNFKVLDDNGQGDVSMVIAAVEMITARKLAQPATPMVANLSLGEDLGTPAYSALDEAVEASVAAGVVYVVAAGNHGKNAASVTPAKVTSAITVGSYDVEGRFSSFSNWGSKIDLLAPGEEVVSLAPASSGTGGAVEMSGTSMAAAHVSGAVALYLGQHPTASPAQVRQALLDAAKTFVVGTPNGTASQSVWVGADEGMSPFTSALVVQHSGQCLDVYAGSQENGATLIQWPCHSGSNQQFEMKPVAGLDEVYTLVAQHSGKCLDVLGGLQTNGAPLIQWSCTGGGNQQFKVEPVGSQFQLVAQHSGKCVGVAGSSAQNGAPLVQQSCTGGGNQRWQVPGYLAE